MQNLDINGLSTQCTVEAAEFISYYYRLSSRRLLLLDPEDSMVGKVQDPLKIRHFVVTRVKSGPEGLQCILKQREFDLILCDISTRHSPGLMFYRAVHRIRPHLGDRFIFMSGRHGNPEADSFVRNINGVVLWKPFETHVLLETIELVLKKQDRDLSILPGRF